MRPLKEIRDKFGNQPEYFESYARVLYNALNQILKVRKSDIDIFKPQLSYLEQLLYARYRLSMDNIAGASLPQLKEVILSKDEKLLKRGVFMHLTGGDDDKVKTGNSQPQSIVIKDGNGAMAQKGVADAIFGSNLRKDGEKTVERVITIRIRDSVIE
jgi:hypothetical protein